MPCADDGRRFVVDDRLRRITRELTDSRYSLLADLPLAKLYGHREFREDSGLLLVSCHVDSLYDNYFARRTEGELHGTFDNSACNAILLEAMLGGQLPPQALVAFTGNEEYESRGADQTIEFLGRQKLLERLAMVIVLDLTEEHYGVAHYTIENDFVASGDASVSPQFRDSSDLRSYLARWLESPRCVDDAAPDESWQYDEHDLNCFSLCLPCRLLGDDMHDDTGVAITESSATSYLSTLAQLTRGITEYLEIRSGR
jgi:hypothetical protein